jgi:GAF domain-containing protein
MHDNPVAAGDGSAVGIVAVEKKTLHLHDSLADPRFTDLRRQQVSRARTMLAVPLLREDEVIGVVFLARTEVQPFTERQVDLITSFADQAVIAISNVNLFEEVQARTRDLTESLQQQTATAEVLKVISRSAFDLQTVLETLIKSAVELSGAYRGSIFLREGDVFPLKAASSTTPEFLQYWAANPPRAGRGSATSRVILSGKVEIIPDIQEDAEIQMPASSLARIRGTLGVPMLRDNKLEGVLVLTRPEPGPFTASQIALVQTFADQAVIAVENVRLFDEVKQRTEDLSESLQQQTATADVLKVISRSAFDLQTVLDTLVESAARLCDADRACVFKKSGELFYWVSNYGFSEELIAYANTHPFAAGTHSTTARVALEGKAVHNPDVLADPNYKASEYQRLGNYRTMLGIPLLREGAPIGVFILAREQVRPFSNRQIDLVTSFADQAVIAIENVRLFDEVQARTKELAASLDDLRTAQDRLVQTEKLASLGQLTAGIAHEIKNPLNFVNNFASLSAELTGELNDVLKQVEIGDKLRAEVDELTGLLKDNLEKVVQHGKRADSIVKNMLLHSREGGGEHRPSDINALIDESLNLAYHGARAEKPDFNVTLQRDFDQDAGQVDLFPQEITRVLLNLVSNGFYAVTKRRKEGGEAGFEPTLRASTKSLGESVEIRIRDNGIGIPAEVKEKMFNPFFTTKPAGEGTGLGLSMSHDIIVKQHGGTIDVDTSPGHFTEFRIVLPRTSNLTDKFRG